MYSTNLMKYVQLGNSICIEFGERVVFQSYPRTGNTFLRSYLEKITGVFTGTDMDIDWTFMCIPGSLGQNITGETNRVWITKTHEPG